VICPTAQAEMTATDWHDGQMAHRIMLIVHRSQGSLGMRPSGMMVFTAGSDQSTARSFITTFVDMRTGAGRFAALMLSRRSIAFDDPSAFRTKMLSRNRQRDRTGHSQGLCGPLRQLPRCHSQNGRCQRLVRASMDNRWHIKALHLAEASSYSMRGPRVRAAIAR
jgi:hypothetical protein